MSQRRIRTSLAGFATLVVFALVFLAIRPGQESISQPAGAEKPKQRPAGKPLAMPANLSSVTLSLGLKDSKVTDWDGSLSVSEGRIIDVEIVRGNPKAEINGKRFTIRTTVVKKANKMKAPFNRPIIRVTLDAPLSASLKVDTKQGKFTVALADLSAGGLKTYLEGAVSALSAAGSLRLTDAETEDDYPALAKAPDGNIWLVYSEYQYGKPIIEERIKAGSFESLAPTGNGDQIRLRRFDGKEWSPLIDITDTGLDIWRPAIAIDPKGVIHIAWGQQVDGNWDIYQRSYKPGKDGTGGELSAIARLTTAKGSDFHVVAAVDAAGDLWLAWQGWRDGNFHIHTAQLKGADPKNADIKQLTNAKANHWSPAIAADSKGNVYVLYDTYEKENYDIHLQVLGKNPQKLIVAGSARFEVRPVVVCDAKDRLWIAYEEGDEQWGKDYSTNQFRNIGFEENPGNALYIDRTIRVKCLADGKLMTPAGDLQKAFGKVLPKNKSVARLGIDGGGSLWLLCRHHPTNLVGGEVWNSYALRYDGKTWSSPQQLPGSANLMDNRPGLAPHGTGLLAVYSGDKRTRTQDREQCDLHAAVLQPSGKATAPDLVPDRPADKAELKPVHPNEVAHVKRIRDYRIDYQGKKLKLLRGEFHRHTEYTAHSDIDGLLEDMWRYGLDAGHMDWLGNGDHNNGFGHEYCWWQIQKTADIVTHTPTFLGAQTYERSIAYPDGHRNVMMPKRGIRPLQPVQSDVKASDPVKGSPDTKRLYAYLKFFNSICSSHTSGTGMGTDWRDNDPVVEPVVEIYQGHRHNYEHYGAPRSATDATNIGGYKPKGFVWNAFDKGYKMGFQASSDHVSTHMSYAIVLTDDFSRPGLINAFKQRHSYAATDNIILEVRCGKQLMGDIFETAERPVLDIKVQGTAPIAKLHVIRDSQYVYTDAPNKAEVTLRYTDADAAAGKTSFYYVRIEQTDANLAWSSPMWITYRP